MTAVDLATLDGRGFPSPARFFTPSIVMMLTVALSGCAIHYHQHFDNGQVETVSPPMGRQENSPIPAKIGNSKITSADSVTEITPVWHQVGVESPANEQRPQQGGVTLPSPTPLKTGMNAAPEVGATSGLTLDQAINACLLADPKLRAGFEGINQANADALTASLKPNPELFTDAQLLPLTRPFTVTEQGGPPQQDVNVSYPIDWFLFGKRAAAMAAATLGVRVSESDYADLVRQRVTETALAYYDVVEAKALLGLARQDVENLQQVESLTLRGREAGTISQVDLNRVRLDLINGQRNLREAEATVATSKAKLRALLGRGDADPTFDVMATLDAPIVGPSVSVEDALATAMQARPDLQSNRWKLAQAQASIEAERRKAYPTLSPQFGYTRQYQTKAIGFPDANSWSTAITMSIPLNDRNQGNRAKAVSVASQSNYDLQLAVVELRSEIESVTVELRTARAHTEAVAKDQLKLATAVRDDINAAYRAGTKPLIDALDAQRNFRETYRTYYSSRANYWRAFYKFQSAIGQQVLPHDEHPGQQNPGNPR